MLDWFGDCTHLPGIEYGEGADRHRAYATVTDARASEASLVFDGATPHAMIEKAERMAAVGRLTERQLRAFEDGAHRRVQGAHRALSRAVPAQPRPAAVGGSSEAVRRLIAAALDDLTAVAGRAASSPVRAQLVAIREGRTISADTASQIQAAIDSLDAARDHHDTARDTLNTLIGITERAKDDDEDEEDDDDEKDDDEDEEDDDEEDDDKKKRRRARSGIDAFKSRPLQDMDSNRQDRTGVDGFVVRPSVH
jgi:hypothetical protein